MVRITIDKAMQEKLLVSNEMVGVFDESGQLLGQFLPHLKEPPEEWEPITPELSEEELKRRSEYDGPGISTHELIARLKAKS